MITLDQIRVARAEAKKLFGSSPNVTGIGITESAVKINLVSPMELPPTILGVPIVAEVVGKIQSA